MKRINVWKVNFELRTLLQKLTSKIVFIYCLNVNLP